MSRLFGVARRIGVACALILASLGMAGIATAANDQSGNPITVYTQDASARAPGGLAEQLAQRAAAQGQIRVIVGIRMIMRPEHRLSAAAAATQRRALQTIQSRIAARVLGSASAQSQDRFTFIPYMSMFVNASQLRRLLADPQVVSIQEDVPQPPLLDQSSKIINADDVWAEGFVGSDQVVAILDTGVDKTHPMFFRKVVSEACYSTTNGAGTAFSLCPGGVQSSTAPGSGINCDPALIKCGHGTHVAGIAAGSSAQLNGIGRDAKIIAIQVFSRLTEFDPDQPRAFDTDLIKGLQRVHALRNTFKIAAVNMSLGGGQHGASCDAGQPALTTAIKNLRDAGIATVIASGNNGFTGFINSPACISQGVAVGNTTKKDRVFEDSNHSPLVKLMAPGTSIRSAVPGNAYGKKTGTSMAAPHVAGAFALLRDARANATVDDILEALACSGKIVDQRSVAGGPVELDPQKPRIDLLGAFNHLKKPPNVIRSWSFGDESDLREWSPLRGTWSLSGGTYKAVPTEALVGSHVANCNTRLKISAKLKRIDTQAEQTGFYASSGFFFKTTTNFTSETVSGYFVGYNRCPTNPSGFCTGLPENPPGQLAIIRFDSLNLETGFAPTSSLLCTAQVPIVVNDFNIIRMVSDGPSHSAFLNGKLACTVADATYAAGGIVLGAQFRGSVAGDELTYEYLTIQSIGRNRPAPESAFVMDPAAMAPKAAPESILGSWATRARTADRD